MNKYFGSEVPGKLGREVKSLRDFSGVPKDTHGTVVDYWKADKGRYGVDILWHRFAGDTLKDGFSKSDYDEFLEEV